MPSTIASASFDTASVGSRFSVPALQVARSADEFVTHSAWGHSQRGFESAETTRLNQAHWRDATDESVNSWLADRLPIIRARSAYERRQNAMLAGVVKSHADSIVGRSGPTLQVITEDAGYAEALERVWRQWFSAPTHLPNVSGSAWLKMNIRSLWDNGEYLAQIINDPQARGPVKMRLRPLSPRLLATPAPMTGQPNMFMGIRFDRLGRPTQYYVFAPDGREGIGWETGVAAGNYRPIPPRLMIHEFLAEEPDQARGVPWSNPALIPAADLRDYDQHVGDAAEAMTDNAAVMVSNHLDAAFFDVPETMEVERRVMRMAPPGWDMKFAPAVQPPVQYPDYRAERQRDFGRHVGMPLVTVRMDASGHNYSSARLDTQAGAMADAGYQAWISGDAQNTGLLNRLVDLVATEARFSVPALSARPADVRYEWTWPVRPHVDPKKEAEAEAIGLQNLTVDLSDALAARGTSLDAHIEKLKRSKKLLVEADLPLPAEWVKSPSPQLADAVFEEEEDDIKKPVGANA